MKFHVSDEISQLKAVVVCWGYGIPDFRSYSSNDPEFTKYHKRSWDKELFLKQQEEFFQQLSKYGVTLHFPETSDNLFWQAYSRDTAFVVHDRMYYAKNRGLGERAGEIDPLLKLITTLGVKPEQIIELTKGKMEGGDVLVDTEQIYIGNGSRTDAKTVEELTGKLPCQRLFLGQNVMHLDTRFTILPNKYALIHRPTFKQEDLKLLEARFKLIDVRDEELLELGTNVFVVNPETIFSPKHNRRINQELQKKGFNLVEIDYTEPINLGGSFRCTTMPLVRE